MIFGFNTDEKYNDTIYHVQSEARENELLLQTQVFVRGRCIGKRATSYAEQALDGFTDQQKEQALREQHRRVLDALREGQLAAVLDQKETPEALAAIKELEVQWLNAGSVHSSGTLVMQLRVTEGGAPAEGALLTLRFSRSDAAPFYSQLTAGADGNAELLIDVSESSLADASVLVQASFLDRTVTRKFELRKMGE